LRYKNTTLEWCVVFNDTLELRIKFSTDDYMDKNSVEQSEIFLLKEFKNFIEQSPIIDFIHWNVNLDGFDFRVLIVRAKELGGIVFPEIPQEKLFDLAAYVAYLSKRRLFIKQILWFNSFFAGNF